MIDVMDKRNEILDFIKEVGPTLPVRIAKKIEMEPLFVSAILNEMVKDGLIKLSSMKHGASRFYFLPGQEEKLCEFAEEDLDDDRPAYKLLKDKKYLKDSEQDPQIRVSLRGLKDFAISFNYEGELYWKFMFTPDEEIEELLKGKNSKTQDIPIESERIEESEKEDKKIKEISPIVLEKEVEERSIDNIFDEDNYLCVKEEDKTEIFSEVENFLMKKRKELKVIEFNKNEVVGVCDFETDLGNISFLVIAKAKKTFSDADVLLVNDRASREKKPLYLLLKGKLTKKAEKLLGDYKNLIVVENF